MVTARFHQGGSIVALHRNGGEKSYDDPPLPYEPSQKYSSLENLYLALDDEMAAQIRTWTLMSPRFVQAS
jgi:hypothetical protein